MIVSLLKITLPMSKKHEALDLLHYVLGPTRVAPGCLDCSLYEEAENQEILYMEQWRSREDFYDHIKSSSYMSILTAMELSVTPPGITFIEATEMDGMKLITTLRAA